MEVSFTNEPVVLRQGFQYEHLASHQGTGLIPTGTRPFNSEQLIQNQLLDLAPEIHLPTSLLPATFSRLVAEERLL